MKPTRAFLSSTIVYVATSKLERETPPFTPNCIAEFCALIEVTKNSIAANVKNEILFITLDF